MALGNIDKKSGLASLPETVAIEAEPTEVTELDDEALEVVFGEEPVTKPVEYDHYENLAESLEQGELLEIGIAVLDGYRADKDSRADWEKTLGEAVKLLGLKGNIGGELPFKGSCDVVHPLIIENVVKFQSKATQETLPPGGPVKTQIIGASSEELERKAQRVKDYMNYQLTVQISEYYEEEEKALFYLPFAGVAFKKIYWSEAEQRPCSEFLRADDLVVSALAPSLARALRITHVLQLSKVELDKAMAGGVYREIDLGTPSTPELSTTAEKMNETIGVNLTSGDSGVYTLLEQHCWLETGALAADDGTALPYVVTVDRDTGTVLAVRRGWRKDDPLKKRRQMFVKKEFVPTDSFYPIGYAHMLGSLTRAITAGIRSLVDAGQFANLQAGFKLKGMKVAGDNTALKPGEWRDVEVPGSTDIRGTMLPIDYKEPSNTLFNMVKELTLAGQKFADTTDMVVSDSTNYGPVGTTLALLEASTKFYSAVHKRLHKAQREELEILAEINEEYLPPEGYPYDVVGGDRSIARADFDAKIDIIPVTDPNVVSQSHRAALAQAVLQVVEKSPQLHDVKAALRYFYTTLNVPEIDKLLPPAPQPQQQDPVSDLMSAARGQPIGAFPGQDHDAHIGIKSAWLQDPLQGANPLMQAAAQAVAANVREHMILKYQEQIAGFLQLGKQQNLPPEAAEEIMVVAAKKILAANQLIAEAEGEAAGTEAAMIALEKRQLDLQEKEMAQDAVRDAAQLAVRNRQLDVQEKNINLKAAIEGVKLAEKKKSDEQKNRTKMASDAVKALVQVKDMESNERIAEKQMESAERQAKEQAKAAKAQASARKASKPKAKK
jgi:hypothetical protein